RALRRGGTDARRIDIDVEQGVGAPERERRRHAVEMDPLDPARDLSGGALAELELVEHVARDAIVKIWIEQPVQGAAGIVRARRGEVLVAALHAQRGGHLRKFQIERFERDLDAALLLFVGEGLANAVARQVEWIGKTNLIV